MPAAKKKPQPNNNKINNKNDNPYFDLRNAMTAELKAAYANMQSIIDKFSNLAATSLGFDAAQRIKDIGEAWTLNDWSVVPPFKTGMIFDAYAKRQQQTLESDASDKVKQAVINDLTRVAMKMKSLEALLL